MASPTAAKRKLAAIKAARGGGEKEEESDRLSPVTWLTVDVTDTHGRRWEGRFRFNVPTMGDIVEIGKLKTALLGGQGDVVQVDTPAFIIVEMMAFCEITIDHEKAPSWWSEIDHGAKLYDAAPLRALYEEGRAYETKFHGDDSSSGSDEDEASASEDGGRLPAHGPDDMESDLGAPAERREVIVAHRARSDDARDREAGG